MSGGGAREPEQPSELTCSEAGDHCGVLILSRILLYSIEQPKPRASRWFERSQRCGRRTTSESCADSSSPTIHSFLALASKLAPLLPHPTPSSPSKQARPRQALAAFLRRFSPTRLLIVALLAATLILLPTYIVLRGSFDTPEAHNALWAEGGVGLAQGTPLVQFKVPLTPEEQIAELVLHGGVIMPKLGNETVKAELGRASWKLLRKSFALPSHPFVTDLLFGADTMAARFPEHPTESERDAFKSFIYLFSRLYPCGEQFDLSQLRRGWPL